MLPVLHSIPQPCSACCLLSCSSAKFCGTGTLGGSGAPSGPGGSGNLLVALLNSPGCQLAPCGQWRRPRDNLGTLQGQLRDNSGLCIWFCPLGPFISRHLGASVQFWGLIKSKNLDSKKNEIIICSPPHCHSTRGPGDTCATSVTADPLLLPRQGRGIPLVGTGTAGLASCPSVGLLPRARAASTPWQCPPWGHQ